jgi:hypothetical protein
MSQWPLLLVSHFACLSVVFPLSLTRSCAQWNCCGFYNSTDRRISPCPAGSLERSCEPLLVLDYRYGLELAGVVCSMMGVGALLAALVCGVLMVGPSSSLVSVL